MKGSALTRAFLRFLRILQDSDPN